MNIDEASAIAKSVLAAFPTWRARMSPADVSAWTEVWITGLLDLDREKAEAAAARLLLTAKAIPALAELREAMGIVEHGHRKTGLEAWGAVIRAMKSQGAYRVPRSTSIAPCECTPAQRESCRAEQLAREDRAAGCRWRWDFEFHDPITAELVEAMNWAEVCTADDLTADRARFIQAYDERAKNARRDAQALPGGTNHAQIGPGPKRPTLARGETRPLLALLPQFDAKETDKP